MADLANRRHSGIGTPRLAGALVALLCIVLAGCSSTPAPPSDSRLSPAQSDILFQAFGLIGKPYRYGGDSPATGFDCSGLIHYVYQEAAGIKLPRTTAELSDLRTKKPQANALQPGDLVLFSLRGGRKVNHAGIYVGDGRFVHAPRSGGRVRLDSLDARYWRRRYQGARRVLDR
ncbi:MAG: C40 family peptidase [Porticoccaceae bacterium]